ncbi:DUF2651 family protein [Clostridium sp. D2Q-14]|uniref:DUF2651 family protein n=1 Tax=Anaeromonas gelatinilytica TaxID=2683194 RepID=UPI00193AE385|nr:DUF2651 family protein [Anaeromonas gelatinilytica]
MEFTLVLIIFPVAVILLSMIVTGIVKKFYIMPIITFLIFLILTYTVFNESFFIWVIVYAILSLIVSVTIKFVVEKDNKNKV